MSQQFSNSARDDVFKQIMCNVDAMRSAGESPDPSVLALAMWAADPGSGELRVYLAERYKTVPGERLLSWLGIAYAQMHDSFVGIVEWDTEGSDAVRREFDWRDSVRALGCLAKPFFVSPENLSGLRAEFGLGSMRLEQIETMLAGVAICPAREWRVAHLKAICTPEDGWGNLTAAPLDDDDFLRLVAKSGSPALQQHLLGGDISLRNRLAFKVIGFGSPGYLQKLLDTGVSPNAREDQADWRLIHVAACSSFDSLRTLVANGADVMIRDGMGDTALHHATQDERICEFLLAHGADMVALNNDGHTPLHKMLGHPFVPDRATEMIRVVGKMLSLGADLNYVPPGADVKYLTPFQSAVKAALPVQVEAVLGRPEVDLAQRTLAGKTLAHLAAKSPPMKALLRSRKAEQSIGGAFSESMVHDDAPSAARAPTSMGML